MNYDERLGKAIDRAAGELPEDYEVFISIEKHAGTAILVDPEGETVDAIEYDGENLADTIENAVACARSREQMPDLDECEATQ